MLTMKPKGWWGLHCLVLDEAQQPVAEVSLAFLSSCGSLTIHGVPYHVRREGLFGGSFVLEREGAPLARARPHGFFSQRFEIEAQGKRYVARRRARFSGDYVVEEGATPIASIMRGGHFVHKTRLQVLADVSLPVQVFLLWLMLMLWRRTYQS